MIFKKDLRTSLERVLLIMCLTGVCLFAGCGKNKVATAGNESEANLMFDILHSNGFHVEKSPSEGEAKTWDINVDEGWFGDGYAAAAIQVLRDYGLPRPPEPEIKTNDTFGMASERAEKERQKRELQSQIERQLYLLPDVIRASVIIAQPTNDILSLEKTPPTASVTLVLKETQQKFTTESVQSEVSGDVPNLKPENVNVLITQQALRDIPFQKLEERRRSNTILAVGVGVISLLALALGALWWFVKRRREEPDSNVELLPEGELPGELPAIERPLLNAENVE